MKNYTFNIHIGGLGETKEEAWEDVVEGFMLDPGSCPDDTEISAVEELD